MTVPSLTEFESDTASGQASSVGPEEDIWAWLVGKGYIAGNPEYYTSGEAADWEVRHALSVGYQAIQATGDTEGNVFFWESMVNEGYIEGNPAYYSGGQAGPAEITHAFNVASGTTPEGTPVTTTPPTDKVKIMGGSFKWYHDPNTGLFYVSYKLPNSGRELVFEASQQDVESVFGDGQLPPNAETTSLKALTGRDEVTFAGFLGEVATEDGSTFQENVDRVLALALDEGRLPEWATGDGKAEELLFIAVSEGKSDDWLLTQMTKLDSFTTRFPGYETFKAEGVTAQEAVAAHLQAERQLRQFELQFGGNPDRITPQTVADIAANGYSMTDVGKAYSVFKRMKDFAPAFEAFNAVLDAAGLPVLGSTEELYAFLNGSAPADVYEVYEASSLREAAVAAGIGDMFSADAAIAAAAEAPFAVSPERAYQALQQSAANILRFRAEINLGKHNLNAEDLIDISLGLAPSSGASQADITMNMEAALSEAQGFLKDRVTPFFGFTQKGRPQARSFGELRGQSV